MRLKGGNRDHLKLLKDADMLRYFAHRKDTPLLPQPFFNCANCGKRVDVDRHSRIGERLCCSRPCLYEYWRKHGVKKRTTRKSYRTYVIPKEFRMMNALRKLSSGNLTAEEAARLRQQISKNMGKMIEEAETVVLNGKHWTPTQARVFGLLLGKVLPDLSASHVISERRNTNPEEMSIEELERMVAEQRAALEAAEDDDDTPASEQIIEQIEYEKPEEPED